MLEIRTNTESILEHLSVPPQKSSVTLTLKLTQTNPDAKLDSFAYLVIFCQTGYLPIMELHYSHQLTYTHSICIMQFSI